MADDHPYLLAPVLEPEPGARCCSSCREPLPADSRDYQCWRCMEQNKKAMFNDSLRQWIPIIVIGAALLLLAL